MKASELQARLKGGHAIFEKVQEKIGWSPKFPKENPLQLDLLKHFPLFKRHVVMSGKQNGKTMVSAFLAFCALIEPQKHIWVVGPNYDLTGRIWDYMMPWLHTLEGLFTVNRSTLVIHSKMGSRVEFKSADGGKLVGATLDGMIIDEAALVPEDIWLNDLHPCLAIKQGWCVMISTPLTLQNWFTKEHEKGKDEKNLIYKSYTYPSESNPYFPKESLELAKQSMPWSVFARNHLAIPEAGGSSVYPYDLLNAVCSAEPEGPDPTHTYAIGVDLGKEHDFSVLSVFDYTARKQVYVDRFNHIDYPIQQQRLKILRDRFTTSRPPWILVDATGLGRPVCDQLIHDGISITPVVFRYRSKSGKVTKQDLVEHLRLLFARHEIKILKDVVQRKELEAFQATTTLHGNVLYEAPKGSFDDCVVSLALSTWMLPLSAQPEAEKSPQALTPMQQYLKAGLDAYDHPTLIDPLDLYAEI